jgi:predicted RND superfamily exporter protein
MPSLRHGDFNTVFGGEDTIPKTNTQSAHRLNTYDGLKPEELALHDLNNIQKDIHQKKANWDFNHMDGEDPLESFDISMDQFHDFLYNTNDSVATEDPEPKATELKKRVQAQTQAQTQARTQARTQAQETKENFDMNRGINQNVDMLLIIMLGILMILILFQTAKLKL